VSLHPDIVAVALDTSPLGLASNPHATAEAESCRNWLAELTRSQVKVVIPEIADYELRRELLLAARMTSLSRLDALIESHNYIQITTTAMRRAATFWAASRHGGKPTSDPKSLDGDVILAAQVEDLQLEPDQVVVATSNVSHIRRFVNAALWEDLYL